MKPANLGIERVAVIGAGTIGASWAAYFLARGLSVTASDPAPNGEEFVRRTVAAAWPDLTRLGLAPGASPDRLSFVRDPVAAVSGADFVPESGARPRESNKARLGAPARRPRPAVVLQPRPARLLRGHLAC